MEVRKYYPDWEYIKIGIDCDHIHLHMVIPPKYSVSEAVEIIKTQDKRSLNYKSTTPVKAWVSIEHELKENI
ncbi:MAG: transposase [Candidatus Omnitrophica bacterium]|nr:transposase [Candidatus Omnitrophota bacterium]